MIVGLVAIDSVLIVVASSDDCWLVNRNASIGTFVGIGVTRVGRKGTSSVMSLIGNHHDFFSDKIISRYADAAVSVPVIIGIFGAGNALSADSDVADFAPAADFEPILMESADGRDKGVTGLIGSVVDFVHAASLAGSVYKVVAEGANTGLFVH